MKKAVIIGAGPAGLTAGIELLRRSPEYRVIILEESTGVGGISRTVNHHGNRMDMGGHRFFSKDPRVVDWWLDMLPMQGKPAWDDLRLGRNPVQEEGGPDPERVDRVMLRRSRVSRIYYHRKFFDYPIKMNLSALRSMGAGTACAAGCSYVKSLIAKRPEDSLESFYINRFGKKLYSLFFESYTEKLWGRHPREISADWGAQRVKGLSVSAVLRDVFGKLLPSGKKRRVETSLIEEFYYPKYGPGQLWERAAEVFCSLGGEIRFGCRVTGLKLRAGHAETLRMETPEGMREENADWILSSMPLKDLVEGMDPVPGNIRDIAAKLPYRDFVTVGLLLRGIKLKNTTRIKTVGNIVPDCWIYVQDPGVKLGRIQIFNNWSCYMAAKPEETLWIGLEYFCTEGDSLWNMSETQWRDFAAGELVQMGIIDPGEPVLDFHCEKVKKAYPAYFDSYARIGELIRWLDGIDNLYCIGRNGQHRYNNMDHSMVTAFEAVGNLIEGRKDRSNIWTVNTEKEYHEEKTGE